jgi:hypothetical protein
MLPPPAHCAGEMRYYMGWKPKCLAGLVVVTIKTSANVRVGYG